MTNAELYIGDEDLIDQFIDEFNEFACKQDWDLEYHRLRERLVEFFKQERKPTLTEDERVILRNLQNVRYIGRTEGTGYLYATFNTIDNYANRSDITDIDLYFSKMFSFIKERRRI